MSDSKFSTNQIDVEGLSNDPTMQANLGNSTLVLNDITDVTLGSPVTNEVLTFDGSNWVNATAGAGSVTNPLTSDLDVAGFDIIGTSGSTNAAATIDIIGGTVTFGVNHGGSVNITGGDSHVSYRGGDVTLTPGISASGTAYRGNVQVHFAAGTIGEAEVRLWRDTDTGHTTGNYVSLKASSTLATNVTLTLPVNDGNSGDLMQTDGAGVLSFVAPAIANPMTSDLNLAGYNIIGSTATGPDNAIATIDILAGDSTNTGVGGDINLVAGDVTIDGYLGGNISLTPGSGKYSGSYNAGYRGAVDIHHASNLAGGAEIRLWDDHEAAHTSGIYVALKAPIFSGSPAQNSNLTLTLPLVDGSNGNVLTTDGSGNLSFTAAGSLSAVVDDTSPQLGGNLDLNSKSLFGDLIVLNAGSPALPNALNIDTTNGRVAINGLPNESSGALQITGDIHVEGGVNYRKSDNSVPLATFAGGTNFFVVRDFVDVYTVQSIWSPPGEINVGSPLEHVEREATLALVRGNEPNQEFMDVYNNGYISETQFGIRMQKRGTGVYRPFVIDYYDGTTKTTVLTIDPDQSVTFEGDLTVGGNIAVGDDGVTQGKITLYNNTTEALGGTLEAVDIAVPGTANDIMLTANSTSGQLYLGGQAITFQTNNGTQTAKIGTDGQFVLNATPPSDPAHLTRKDYVDDNFVLKNENAASFTDADALVDTGVYSTDGAWTGSVFVGTSNNNQGILTHKRWNATYSTQTFAQIQDVTSIWNRIQDNGVWGAWVRNADRDYVDDTTVALDGSRTMTAPLVFNNLLNTSGTIELYQGDLAAGYAIGVESGATYYRANGNHRWYISTLADAGVSDYMNLSTSGLDVVGLVTSTSLNMTTPGADVTTGVTKVCVETGDDGTIRHGTDVAVADFIKDTSSTQSNKTLTSPVLNTGVSGTAIDTTVTTSTTKIPHSSAVKTYVDGLTGGTSVAAKNVIINGNFDFWQRGTGFVTPVNGDYTADRIQYHFAGLMNHNVNRGTDVPTYAQSGVKSNYSYHLDVNGADASIANGDYTNLTYAIEGYDYAQIAGGDATLSFWIKAAKTGIHCISFKNSGADRTYIAEYSVTTANTWEKKTVTVTLDNTAGTWNYTNGTGLEIGFTMVAGSTYQTTKDAWQTGNFMGTSSQVNECDNAANNLYIAQLQFEQGDTATAFEFKDYASEFNRCIRYYEQYSSDTDDDYIAPGYFSFGQNQDFIFNFAKKRAIPTVTTSAASEFAVVSNAVTTSLNSITISNISIFSFRIESTTLASGTVNAGCMLKLNAPTTEDGIFIDAEL